MIDGDSLDYHIIVQSTEFIKDVPGMTCEIGLRKGRGTQCIIDAIYRTHKVLRTHIAIDPYGGLPYVNENVPTVHLQQGPYHNEMMREAIVDLYTYCKNVPNVNFYFFPLEDHEFFKRYSDGVPVYTNGKKQIINKYALVVFDGPHDLDSVMKEAQFFHERASKDSIFVFDDTGDDPKDRRNGYFYDHRPVNKFLVDNGWVNIPIETKKKTVYQYKAR